ncbi:hypothetical protein NAV33_07205 [Pseudomonas stutzeri]|uniref:hypothetical protein n=1 Tax=Stutzerimonas stutzeri TaxID=316 RepID=UPI0021092A82|nr:hypothetical protein [Stutzerimonas stutzeri]MCQ4311681.1 hypothetical protein [Stutzerimonas stutzeri]
MQKFINNWSTVLTGVAQAADGIINVEPLVADRLVSLSSGDHYVLTLEAEGQTEIVKVTAQSAGALTVQRAQEDTVARSWPAGTPVYMRITAGTLDALRSSGGTGSTAWGSIGGSIGDQVDLAELLANFVPRQDYEELLARVVRLEEQAVDPNALTDADGNLLVDAENTVLTTGATA